MRIDFYITDKTPVNSMLLKVIEKLESENKNCTIFCPLEKDLKAIDDFLWVFDENEFLPHKTENDKITKQLPIVIQTDINDKIENSNIAIFINGKLPNDSEFEKIFQFERCIFILKNTETENKTQLKKFINENLKGKDFNLFTWVQSSSGKWDSKELFKN